MTTNYKDPKTYLESLISKRGKSGSGGVYLTNLTIVAEAESDYGYKANYRRCGSNTPPVGTDLSRWHQVLVNLREDNSQLPFTLNTERLLCCLDDEAIYQFIPEGASMSLNVFLPFLDSKMFEHWVCTTQDMLSYAAGFASKFPSHIRFTIGYATSKWDDLVDSGEVIGDFGSLDELDNCDLTY